MCKLVFTVISKMTAGGGGWEQHAWVINLSYDFEGFLIWSFWALILISSAYLSVEQNFQYLKLAIQPAVRAKTCLYIALTFAQNFFDRPKIKYEVLQNCDDAKVKFMYWFLALLCFKAALS